MLTFTSTNVPELILDLTLGLKMHRFVSTTVSRVLFQPQALFTQDILMHNIMIKRYCNKKIFLKICIKTKVSSLKIYFCALFMHLDFFCQELTLVGQQKPVSQYQLFITYLFIAIQCAKMSCVNKASVDFLFEPKLTNWGQLFTCPNRGYHPHPPSWSSMSFSAIAQAFPEMPGI